MTAQKLKCHRGKLIFGACVYTFGHVTYIWFFSGIVTMDNAHSELALLIIQLHCNGVIFRDMVQVVEERLHQSLSVDQLRRLCKKLNLHRRRSFASVDKVEAIVKVRKFPLHQQT